MPGQLATHYDLLKRTAAKDLKSEATTERIILMAEQARQILTRAEQVPLKSRVAGKTYFGYRSPTGDSRPINKDLYADNAEQFVQMCESFQKAFAESSSYLMTRTTYTIASTIFAANDIDEVGRKASATFFEILIGHIVARFTDLNPTRKVIMPETGVELTTDYIFDAGSHQSKLHLPLKTSTRERAVQAWVHQLVLDRIFGDGAFKGILVVSAETKRNAKNSEVIEILVPKQLQMFQARVARMTRVYYLDAPEGYLALSTGTHRVTVKPFGDIFAELPGLLKID